MPLASVLANEALGAFSSVPVTPKMVAPLMMLPATRFLSRSVALAVALPEAVTSAALTLVTQPVVAVPAILAEPLRVAVRLPLLLVMEPETGML